MTATAFTTRFTEADDGTRLYARDYAASDGPDRLPIVCLHGLTRNSRDFEELAPWLAAQGRRVIVPDIRGRGQSDRCADPAVYTPAVYARDVRGQLGELGIERAVFIGTSMGGLITMTLAVRHSRLVAAAVLNDVGPEIAPEGIERIKTNLGSSEKIDSWEDACAYARQVTPGVMFEAGDDDIAKITKRLFRMDGSKPVPDYDPNIVVPLATGKPLPKWLSWAIYRWLARRPVLLIRGETSDVLSRNIARRMARSRKTRFREIPHVGHAPLLDEPETREALGSWLQTVP